MVRTLPLPEVLTLVSHFCALDDFHPNDVIFGNFL
nr:MAG TPA: hypothetical protein [Caudoviricetes sp.]